jgi:hypothetical protein
MMTRSESIHHRFPVLDNSSLLAVSDISMLDKDSRNVLHKFLTTEGRHLPILSDAVGWKTLRCKLGNL